MASIKDTVWPATAHTLAKIEILKNYLNAWFRILGTTKKDQSLLFIDGFAGPGHYSKNEEGSPLAAFGAAVSCLCTLQNDFISKNVHCVFIEKDKDRFNELCATLDKQKPHPRIKISRYECEFVEGI